MKLRAVRNRTVTCTPEEVEQLSSQLLAVDRPVSATVIENRIINQEMETTTALLPDGFVDLLILDPPYNLTKQYHGYAFRQQEVETYAAWYEQMLVSLLPLLKPTATVYACSDWQTSAIIQPILSKHLLVRNRITWERDKGRGARTNWKNNSEDIWFCTVSSEYTFNVDAVKHRKRVVAPYRDSSGKPKDWHNSVDGNYRLTHPSNLWTDITVPFWSMPENTDHPTQKPEKLLAKLILASSNRTDFVLDPFLGSGTSAVVSKKLGRKFCGIERNREYCAWALKRLAMATTAEIQGYHDGAFWERNSLRTTQERRTPEETTIETNLFE